MMLLILLFISLLHLQPATDLQEQPSSSASHYSRAKERISNPVNPDGVLRHILRVCV